MMIEGQAPTAGQSADATPAPSATPSTPAEPVAGVAELNREQTTMIGWIREDLAAGKMTQEQADEAIREATGQDPKDILSDKRSDSERAYDLAFPKAAASDIPWPHTEETTTPQYDSFRNQVNGYMVDAGLTKDSAGYILKLADNFGYQSERWSDEDHVVFGRAEMARLTALWGSQTDARVNMARQMVDKLETARPGLKALLIESGLGNHAGLILELAQHCERLSKRSKP
jgi:hypothetical protein